MGATALESREFLFEEEWQMSKWRRERIWELAQTVQPFAIEARRHLHRYPELSFQERETAGYVADRLTEMGYAFRSSVGGYGIKAVIGDPLLGPAIALRADMDALPIAEETGLEFASARPGLMHACGHDVHTAILLGTARALKELEAHIPGSVVLIFQPGEEVNPGGASQMIKDGVLSNPNVEAIFGLHVAPQHQVGSMTFGAGPRLASPDQFDVKVRGRGGHGAVPHLTIDPVLTACQCITLLQQVVARNVNPFDSAVITVGMINGGVARNVIPDEVTFQGTVRTMNPAVRRLMRGKIESVIRGVCEAAGADYDLTYDEGYPVLVNHPGATLMGQRAAESVLGPANVLDMPPSMGGEDFAFFLEQVPGTFTRLGCTAPGVEGAPGLHTSRLMIDEGCIAVGVAYYLSVISEFFEHRGRLDGMGGSDGVKA